MVLDMIAGLPAWIQYDATERGVAMGLAHSLKESGWFPKFEFEADLGHDCAVVTGAKRSAIELVAVVLLAIRDRAQRPDANGENAAPTVVADWVWEFPLAGG